jgi:ABC-type antimicrobial peptide transport system permease subunit
MDDWLEQELAGQGAEVWTYRSDIAHLQEVTRDLILTMALLESVLTIVAAITLVVLNYIFITQRQSELGVLNALGLDRLRLIWRTLRETAMSTGIAWIASIALCALGLVYQSITFTAKGLGYNWANPVPWLFTLPIPIAVLLATCGTVAWMLSRLDPVAIIERR